MTEKWIRIKECYERINDLKVKLRKSDYKAIKYAEGELTEAEYTETLEQRRAWRTEINDLEVEVREIKNTL